MSGLMYLSEKDFRKFKTPEGIQFSTGFKGFSLILFYSTSCKYCHDFVSLFKKLPQLVAGCLFGMINISTTPGVVAISKDTMTQIKFVPYILFFYNGLPIYQYSGKANDRELQMFIKQTSTEFMKNEKMRKEPQQQQQPQQNKIPAYAFGIPIYGKDNDERCYLEFDKAYKK